MAYINRTSNEWKCESVIQVIEGIITGYTSHFTEFAVVVGKIEKPHVNTLDSDDFRKLGDVNKKTVGVCIYSSFPTSTLVKRN